VKGTLDVTLIPVVLFFLELNQLLSCGWLPGMPEE